MRDWLNLVFIGTLHHVSFCFLNKVLISSARLTEHLRNEDRLGNPKIGSNEPMLWYLHKPHPRAGPAYALFCLKYSPISSKDTL